MLFHRARGDKKPPGDFAVCFPMENPAGDFRFSSAQSQADQIRGERRFLNCGRPFLGITLKPLLESLLDFDTATRFFEVFERSLVHRADGALLGCIGSQDNNLLEWVDLPKNRKDFQTGFSGEAQVERGDGKLALFQQTQGFFPCESKVEIILPGKPKLEQAVGLLVVFNDQ